MAEPIGADCPNCYDGEIVKSGFGFYFCNACFKSITIKNFDGCGRKYIKG